MAIRRRRLLLLWRPIVAANLLAWSAALSVSYVLNSTITFSVEARRELTRAYAPSLLGSWRASWQYHNHRNRLPFCANGVGEGAGDRLQLLGQFFFVTFR